MGEITYPVAEIFRSIQGEGYHTGRPAVFVRLAGCNLECSWCDTDHAVKDELTVQQIRDHVQDLMVDGSSLIVLTGGEPTLYDLFPLLELWSPSISISIDIAIETNGTMFSVLKAIRRRYPGTWITVSPKPQMPRFAGFSLANEIKLVWDPCWNMNEVEECLPRQLIQHGRCFIQPCSGDIQPALNYVMHHPWWRLSLQIHKLIGVR